MPVSDPTEEESEDPACIDYEKGVRRRQRHSNPDEAAPPLLAEQLKALDERTALPRPSDKGDCSICAESLHVSHRLLTFSAPLFVDSNLPTQPDHHALMRAQVPQSVHSQVTSGSRRVPYLPPSSF